MNNATIALIAVGCIGLGVVVDRLIQTSDLAECQRHWHACDFNAEGSTRLISDLSESVEVCELGMEAAAATIEKINDAGAQCERDLHLCKARLLVRESDSRE